MSGELTVTRPPGCISDLRLDAYLVSEVSEAEAVTIRAHAKSCVRCAELLREREAERAGYLSSAPAVRLQNELHRRAALKRRRAWIVGATSALSAVAAILLLVLPRADLGTGTRTKGGPRLGFFVKHGQDVRRGFDGEHVEPGDQLRFTYGSARAIHLTVLSFDAARHASTYLPQARLEPARDAPLSSAVELDATLGMERIYGVFCEAPVSETALVSALDKTSGSLTMPDGCTLDALHIIKEASK